MHGGDHREDAKRRRGESSAIVVGLTPVPGEFQSVQDLSEEDLGGVRKHSRLGVYNDS